MSERGFKMSLGGNPAAFGEKPAGIGNNSADLPHYPAIMVENPAEIQQNPAKFHIYPNQSNSPVKIKKVRWQQPPDSFIPPLPLPNPERVFLAGYLQSFLYASPLSVPSITYFPFQGI